MLYSEFVEGTGCRETDYNYKVYKELEIIYMNSDCTKEHIYEMGKKLVDNSKTEEELRIEAEIKAEIESCKVDINENKKWLEYYIQMAAMWKDEDDKEMEKSQKRMAKIHRDEIKRLRNRMYWLKSEIA